VAAFEREFAAAVGASHACAVSNCTAALYLSLLAAGIQPGDEVITVSHSFIATANSIRYCGATPVFVDVEPGTSNLDPELLDAAWSPKTRAILCVHQMGLPCDMASILAFARRRNLAVIEDAACAIGSEIRWDSKWERIGKPHGDIACFSFHPRKLLTTGDGGMITTSNPEWDQQIRLLRQHGMTIADTTRHASDRVLFESYSLLGHNYRMTDLQASVGRVQLGRLPAILERRQSLAGSYRRLLAACPGILVPTEPEFARGNAQSFWIVLPGNVDQQTVMQGMLERGISTRRGIMNAHREPAYAQPGTHKIASTLEHGEYMQDHAIILPLSHEMTEEDQIRVVETLKELLRSR
jgi:dTDP-4-amino-4,6-dideoxygalactose transaminase